MATTFPSARSFLTIPVLVLGQHVGLDVVDAELARHGLRGRPVVARQHDDVDAVRAQAVQRRPRGRLDRVGDGDDPAGLAIDGHEQGRGPGTAQFVRLGRQFAHLDALVGHELGIAESHKPATDRARDALPGHRGEVGRLLGRDALLLGGSHDGGGQRVLAGPFQARGQPQQVLLSQPGGRDDGRHAGLALGQRPRLVDHQRVDLLHPLQALGRLDEHARPGALADGDHDRHRRGQAQGRKGRR